MKQNIAIAITGASGSIYAKVLLDQVVQYRAQLNRVALVFSSSAKQVWEYELGNSDYDQYDFEYFENSNFFSPIASGSANFSSLLIAPCSMGTMGRIASGISDSLICRAADVMLKERRTLILMLRDTPYNLIHINNMKTITEAGGIICPASPSFYSKPKTMEELARTVVDRALDLAGIQINTYRWEN